jgi:predicted RNase H-like nuclease (RuvC/YqgF family)
MCAPVYERICNECRLGMALKNGLEPDDCECSSNSVAPLLMDHIKELATKNEELASKINELTNENKQLRSKIKSLRKFEGNSDQEGHADH